MKKRLQLAKAGVVKKSAAIKELAITNKCLKKELYSFLKVAVIEKVPVIKCIVKNKSCNNKKVCSN